MHSVIIVSEVSLYREGLKLALGTNHLFSEVSAVSNTDAALKHVAATRPQIILVDLAMSDSLTTVRALRMQVPDAVIVVLTVPDVAAEILACAEAGASAYVTREASVSDLIATIKGAVVGKVRCSTPVADALFQRLSSLAVLRGGPGRFPSLSQREREILRLVAQGLSNKQIAQSLAIETSTVKNHVHSILDKLNVRRRSEAAALVHGVASTEGLPLTPV